MSIKKALFGGGVETNATASYQGSIQDWLPVKNIIGGVVITGGEIAYTRPDGVKIIPIGCLKD